VLHNSGRWLIVRVVEKRKKEKKERKERRKTNSVS
jgi:hypothetical protein